MEVLYPSPPLSPDVDRFRLSSLPFHLRWRASLEVGSAYGGAGKLYVAVGKSPEKTMGLLRWVFRRFGCTEIELLHVHQLSPLIPTPLGKIPVNQANEGLVSSYRRTEREATKKVLLNYLDFCHKAQVHASVIVKETKQIQNGIVDLVAQYNIRKLIMGSASENCFKFKGNSYKETFTAKRAPPFCEIWFVNKGRHIWTREATECADLSQPVLSSDEPLCRGRFWLDPESHICDPLLNPECAPYNFFAAEPQGIRILDHRDCNNAVASVSSADFTAACTTTSCNSREPFLTATSWYNTLLHKKSVSDMNSKDEMEQDVLCEQLKEAELEVKRSKEVAFAELVKRKKLESEVAEAVNRAEAYRTSCEHETKIRKELEDFLRTTKLQQEELSIQMAENLKELQNITETISLLQSHAQEKALLREEASGELEFIQSSLDILVMERQKINKQENIAINQFERLESLSDVPWSLNTQHSPESTSELVKDMEQLPIEERPAPPFFLCPILQEVMHDPLVAADGFTYEGRALRKWLDGGRDTSPMTNLKLDHAKLIPNRALRFVIEDWLSQL